MVVSSFCSHQCSGHSICLTKRLARVWKRKGFCPSATLAFSEEYWGWSRAPVVRIRCLICPLEWEITPLWLDPKQGDWWHGSLPGVRCSRKLARWRFVHQHMVIFVREARKKSIVLVSAGHWQFVTTWEVLSTPSTTSTGVWSINTLHHSQSNVVLRREKYSKASEEYFKD